MKRTWVRLAVLAFCYPHLQQRFEYLFGAGDGMSPIRQR